jgi:lipoyl(octanoyl) transferase
MIAVQDWGLIDYEEAWAKQKEIVRQVQTNPKKNIFVVCHHPSVITIGRKGTSDNIVVPRDFLNAIGIKVIENDRGGDITLHNPGQIVGYPIFNLANYRQDLHWFLREVESSVIELLMNYGIESDRVEGLTGVWVEGRRKICAIGMHCSRWVISHGFALNVNNKLDEFSYIIPCGITGKEVTSVAAEQACKIDYNKIKEDCVNIFKNRF